MSEDASVVKEIVYETDPIWHMKIGDSVSLPATSLSSALNDLFGHHMVDLWGIPEDDRYTGGRVRLLSQGMVEFSFWTVEDDDTGVEMVTDLLDYEPYERDIADTVDIITLTGQLTININSNKGGFGRAPADMIGSVVKFWKRKGYCALFCWPDSQCSFDNTVDLAEEVLPNPQIVDEYYEE